MTERPKATYMRHTFYVTTCKVCGTPFRSCRKGAKTCSDMCRQALSRAVRKSMAVSKLLVNKNGVPVLHKEPFNERAPSPAEDVSFETPKSVLRQVNKERNPLCQ
jgi:predicted nucleic acid-binding Zn ribbon protein